jgi:dihydropteroate synthase
LTILKNISIYHSLGLPILLGISRKKFIKDISKKNDSDQRLGGTISSSIYSMMQGVQILRVHDINETQQGIKVFKELIK